MEHPLLQLQFAPTWGAWCLLWWCLSEHVAQLAGARARWKAKDVAPLKAVHSPDLKGSSSEGDFAAGRREAMEVGLVATKRLRAGVTFFERKRGVA